MTTDWPVSTLQFGVADDSDYVWAGVLGMGYGERFNTNYPTLLDSLVSQGFINVPIFSLGVGSQGESNGRLESSFYFLFFNATVCADQDFS